MRRRCTMAVVLLVPLSIGTAAFAGSECVKAAPAAAPASMLDVNAGVAAYPALPAGKTANPDASTAHPKVVFQTNQAGDASTILRFVTNYLIAEPTAEVAVVGYGGGVDFMLKGAKDAAGKPYADQLQALADKGVVFKACNNTLKGRSLAADAVAPAVTVVPGAVNEIIRLQTREGYVCFRH